MIYKIEKFLLFPFFYFPEGKIKNLMRKLILKWVNELPCGMMVNNRDTIIDVGTPYPKKIKPFKDLVGSRGRIFLVEPEPINVRYIMQYIKKENESEID
ncbi:MAG: hypothetical protein EU529_04180 [Promethearchaeota archaeon]|nr:MAG: hypothetical protein EU529_04180 [Candidatus Lokiarchaeota archaeon]